eukprot:2164325-Prymnesium_polylepis.1
MSERLWYIYRRVPACPCGLVSGGGAGGSGVVSVDRRAPECADRLRYLSCRVWHVRQLRSEHVVLVAARAVVAARREGVILRAALLKMKVLFQP